MQDLTAQPISEIDDFLGNIKTTEEGFSPHINCQLFINDSLHEIYLIFKCIFITLVYC